MEGRGGGSPRGPAARCLPPQPWQCFFDAIPGDFCGGKERKPRGSGERDGPAKVLGMCFPASGHRLPLHQLVDEQLDPGRLRGHAHLPVLLQGEAARP